MRALLFLVLTMVMKVMMMLMLMTVTVVMIAGLNSSVAIAAGFVDSADSVQSCETALIMSALSVDWSASELADSRDELKALYSTQPNHPLWVDWARAVAKMNVLKGLNGKYFRAIEVAAWAALSKHQLQYLREPHLRELDVPRHLEILRAIAGASADEPKFSAYKIKRAIEGRHSLREYTECR